MKLIHTILYWRYIWPVISNYVDGRLYVFRDCPTWVINTLLAGPKYGQNSIRDKYINGLLDEARQELARRNFSDN